ncbi:HAMP domain-containing protein [Massilia antarctica]|uniref:histidine kinase n=1 Tax=Massilia antarctica TaxID=2765360 RepID=A0AA48WE61_9BURK|nr:HAMP domain-containing protein [Massilia antarctica]QPI49809.1 HAMP domain-containing protein [Massilia antarctica]
MTTETAWTEQRSRQRRATDSPGATGATGLHGPLVPGLLLHALDAVRHGDFSVRLPYDWPGLDGRIADALNDIVGTHEKLVRAIERVSLSVGNDGKLGQRMKFDKSDGAWGVIVTAINSMIDNLVQPVREVGRVIGAVARGALTETMQLDIEGRALKGEFLKTANTINTMLAQLNSFSGEVSRVAREVGTEGKLGGQAEVKGASGVWKDLTDNVNLMASNLTGQVRNIAEVTTAVAQGDLSRKITVDVKGEILRLKDTINLMVDQLNSFAGEVTRVAREVGTEGKLGGQAEVKGVSGVWKDLTESVNLMANNLTDQVRNIAEVTTAVARGDLSRKITVDVKGEILRLKDTINIMVDQLNSFAGEVTRVAREVGTEGKLGGQADVRGVAGVWKDLTENVNLMANNLTDQVRNIAEVTTAVARGDLSRKITVGVRGEIRELKDTINIMVDQLNSFAGEVTRVAREVGTEGKLGGQAEVKEVAGVWKDLTDSVNAMASNLTGQVRNIAEVTTAVAKGDLSRKITADVKGEVLELKNTINVMVDQLNSFAGEVTRVAREVGTEGKLGGQAQVKDVSGVWKDLTDSVNAMAGNLTVQLRDVSKVATAIASGDLGQKITVKAQGEILQIKEVINVMVDQLKSFSGEVTRVAVEVGTEGRLGGQAEVEGVSGVWKNLTDSVNLMASNLTGQVRNIAAVTTAVANGDLSQKIMVDVRGEVLQLKDTINIMVDQLNSFAGEVTRVAREVGTEGKLGGQADVKGVSGVWKDLTDNVNRMANNLTAQVRNIATVTTAVAYGDLSQKITVDVRGEVLQLKDTINIMVDQLNSFAGEVTRVALEVGTEGRLGGQAQVPGVAGTWKNLTDSVNLMASNLTGQVRNIAAVTTAVANGDLSQKITVDVRGEVLQLKNTINIMVDQLNAFAGEVTRVAREVGIEGRLGGQAQVKGVLGVWRGLTDNVNLMASNLTDQVRNIATVTTAVANGDLSKTITVDVRGEVLQLKETINTMVSQLRGFAGEVTRVAREVGTEGRLGGQAYVPAVAGVWKDLTDNVNLMASNLTGQVRNIATVTTAVANGDLSRKITVDVRGEILELKNTINVMVDQLNAFSGEVTRVAREVGTEGKLGGQAQVRGISGVWKDLTDSVNLMADNLTDQVRGMAKVVTGVAVGNLKQKMTVPAKGEVAALAETINDMVDTLATFSDQVTRVAREVGVEGRLGGQAVMPGASGSWKDLVDNVNELAANLSTQVRAIGEVATAVTKGDLMRSIQVAARGEVADLKDNLNQMIRNLRETTERNTEQDWLKTNLARLTRMLQGQRDIATVARLLLSELAPLVGSQHAVLYLMQAGGADNTLLARLRLMASYGYQERKNLSQQWEVGEGVVGQAAFEKQRLLITNVPSDYVQIVSGLGQAPPRSIVVLPILFEGAVKAVIEIGAFEPFQAIHLKFLDQLAEGLGIVFNSIETASGTERLLRQQALLLEGEFKSQQNELQKTNAELEQKALQLSEQNAEVERKNREIEVARLSLQEKAEQLARTSKYKSEFLANMSHELRTPLNSLLLLAEQMRQNRDRNLSVRQLEMVRVMHGAGRDLLLLINDILDLSKIESGSASIELDDVAVSELVSDLDKAFRYQVEFKRLALAFELSPALPALLRTDGLRLKQLLKNLLSNAVKFTEHGTVTLAVRPVRSGWRSGSGTLDQAPLVLAFSVSDTGIGIAEDKQKLIFEAFQQADSSTSRRYGGTGLGLAISREIAHLLNGAVDVDSAEGHGSTFTFYLPQPLGVDAAAPQRAAASAMDPARMDAPAVLARQPAVCADAPLLLVIEDDPVFARTLEELAQQRDFATLIARNGADGVLLAQRYLPDAITLDIGLPDGDGWRIADQLREDARTRDIEVHVISVRDCPQPDELHGVASFNTKPADLETLARVFADVTRHMERPLRALLLIGDDIARRAPVEAVLAGPDIVLDAVETAADALRALRNKTYHGMIIALELPDMDGVALLEEIRGDTVLAPLPAILYCERELDDATLARVHQLEQVPETPDARRAAQTRAVVRFLQRVRQALRDSGPAAGDGGHCVAGKTILVVDDDARNLFALASMLEGHDMQVVAADSGQQALEQLDRHGNIDIVLMDIMMPGMDGYDTIARLRRDQRFAALPVIALTAKAMPEDRDKCLAAGASDYTAKPVDSVQLLAQIAHWLAARPPAMGAAGADAVTDAHGASATGGDRSRI